MAVSDSSARSGQLTGSGRQEAWSPAGHAGVVNPGFQETRMFNPEGSNGLVFRNTNNNNKVGESFVLFSAKAPMIGFYL